MIYLDNSKYAEHLFQIWKNKHKEHWILFTNWGRIGDEYGQYQNTPFGNAEQVVAEFEKIFKSKSGNEWKTIVRKQVDNVDY